MLYVCACARAWIYVPQDFAELPGNGVNLSKLFYMYFLEQGGGYQWYMHPVEDANLGMMASFTNWWEWDGGGRKGGVSM